MDKREIRFTKRAEEKLKEIVNGSRKEVLQFFKDIEEKGINWKKENLIFDSDELPLYKKRCKNVYVIFAKGKKGEVIVADFLTETELLDWMK
jgi:hypothetical protein